MSVSFKNFYLSQYPNIDYNSDTKEKIEQGYFTCKRTDMKGRLTSLCDIVSQVAKIIFDSLILAIVAPVLLTLAAVTLIILPFAALLGKGKTAGDFLLTFFVVGAASTLAIPVFLALRVFTLGADILGIACPKIGQSARLRTEKYSVGGLLAKYLKTKRGHDLLTAPIITREAALDLVQKDGRNLQELSDVFRNDIEIGQAAIMNWGNALAFANPELRKNKEVVLIAIEKSYSGSDILQYVSEELRNDKDVVLAAVSKHGDSLKYASEDLRKDRDVVLAAVRRSGGSLQYTSKELRDDKELVLIACTQDGCALEYASDRLKNDPDVVQAALSKYSFYAAHMGDDLRNDKNFIGSLIHLCGSKMLQYASSTLQNDRDVVLIAVQRDGLALKYASNRLKRDSFIVTAAIQQNGKALEYADYDLRCDRDIVLLAMEQNVEALKYASYFLRRDKQLILGALKKSPKALEFADDDLKKNKEFVLTAIQENAEAFFSADWHLQRDPELIMAAAQKDPSLENRLQRYR